MTSFFFSRVNWTRRLRTDFPEALEPTMTRTRVRVEKFLETPSSLAKVGLMLSNRYRGSIVTDFQQVIDRKNCGDEVPCPGIPRGIETKQGQHCSVIQQLDGHENFRWFETLGCVLEDTGDSSVEGGADQVKDDDDIDDGETEKIFANSC